MDQDTKLSISDVFWRFFGHPTNFTPHPRTFTIWFFSQCPVLHQRCPDRVESRYFEIIRPENWSKSVQKHPEGRETGHTDRGRLRRTEKPIDLREFISPPSPLWGAETLLEGLWGRTLRIIWCLCALQKMYNKSRYCRDNRDSFFRAARLHYLRSSFRVEHQIVF